MLGVLLESRARRARRSGGVALSVVTHVALIGAATAATAHRPVEQLEKPATVIVHFEPPPPPRRAAPSTARARSAPAPRLDASILIRHITVPTSVPTSLPDIVIPMGTAPDSVVIGAIGTPSRGGRSSLGLLDGSDGASSSEWRGSEILMRIITAGKPRYPEALRQAGVGGRVLVRFTVDTLGGVDRASVQVVSSTHPLFTKAVEAILPAFRFRPALVNGRRVPALAEMPFEFEISK